MVDDVDCFGWGEVIIGGPTMTSYRVLDGFRVDRDISGRIELVVAGVSGESTSVTLTTADLLALLRFAETGQEPPLTQQEQTEKEKLRELAAFISSLTLPKIGVGTKIRTPYNLGGYGNSRPAGSVGVVNAIDKDGCLHVDFDGVWMMVSPSELNIVEVVSE